MTLLGRLMALFPAFAILADLAAIVVFVLRPCVYTGLAIPAAIYVLPLLTYRVISLFRPLKTGRTRIDEPVYSPWWGSHQAQIVFEAFPALEMPLKLTPFLYRAWLRAWGSSVGRGVYFTPSFRPLDRGLMTIGDGVIFGHDIQCSGHLVSKSKGALVLLVERVTIEDGAFIASGVRMGPGVVVGKGAFIGPFALIGPHVEIDPGARIEPCAVLRKAHGS